MKALFFFSWISTAPAFAFLGTDGTDISQEYACLSLDGMPIQQGSEMANRCCSSGQLIANAPNTCRVGFNSIGPAAGENAAFSMGIARNTFKVAQNMNGATTDFNASDDSGSSSGNVKAGRQGESNAISGSSGSVDLGSVASNPGSSLGATAGSDSAPAPGTNSVGSGSGSEANGGASGSGSSGSGLAGLGSGSGSGANSGSSGSGLADADDAKSDQSTPLTYGYANGEGAGGAHMNGFGGSSANSVGVDKGTNELKFGDSHASRNPNALADAEEDGALGTAEDPGDYFKRIDPSANLFKIVSARYLKKKSLFKVKAE